jgi:hypothetical protein
MFDDPGLRSRKYDLVLARLLIPLVDLADDLKAEFLLTISWSSPQERTRAGRDGARSSFAS